MERNGYIPGASLSLLNWVKLGNYQWDWHPICLLVILGQDWPGLKAVFEEATGKGGKLGLEQEKEETMVGRKEEEAEDWMS